MPSSQNGHFRRTARQRTWHNSVFEKENVDLIKPDMWPPNSPDLNPEFGLFGMPFSNESIRDENLTRWKN